jgi:hypothetical protein
MHMADGHMCVSRHTRCVFLTKTNARHVIEMKREKAAGGGEEGSAQEGGRERGRGRVVPVRGPCLQNTRHRAGTDGMITSEG